MPPVSLFATCLVDAVYPQIGEAAVKVLERLGHEVRFPEEQTCCGLPFHNNGYREEARRAAAHTVRAMAGEEPVVTPAGACAWMMRQEYPRLNPDEETRAFSRRVFELSEFLVEKSDRPMAMAVGALALPKACTATYHPSCHLQRGLRVERPPRRLLESVGGLELSPLPREGDCCGFGGTFAVRQEAVSADMLGDKLDAVAQTGAGTLVVSDPGCLMHLDGGARRRGCPFTVRHLAEVLADAEPE